MPPVDLRFDAPPERVFEVLSQPLSYGYWVVGASAVEDHDADWPAQGAAFRHRQGVWPLLISDETTVESSEPPRRLELVANLRPLVVNRVTFDLRRDGAGTRVRLEERAIGGLLAPFARLPPWPALTRLRNLESLRRLRRLAEGPAVP